ncbi:hypothetical protein B0H19DRAFT_854866, partial [Mycena capillaripes]
CKYCGKDKDSKGAHIEGRDNKLPNHIADSRLCPHAPVSARAEAQRAMASKKPIIESTEDATQASDSTTPIDVDAITSSGDPKARKKRKSPGTLDGYVDQPMTEAQKTTADRKLLRFLIHADVSFRSAEDEYLADFLNDIRPSYDPLKRYVL